MPFGCVAFEAPLTVWFNHAVLISLQCLSAVWPLRPRGTAQRVQSQHHRLQCLSAVWPLRPVAQSRHLVAQGSQSPMPFGCVAFEAKPRTKSGQQSNPKGLQCLSAVWPLRPENNYTFTTQRLDRSPMPFGCVAFEAPAKLATRYMGKSRGSPMPFGCVAFEASCDFAGTADAVGKQLQCLSAVWPLRPRAKDLPSRKHEREAPMPFGCVAFEAPSLTLRKAKKKRQAPMPFGCVAFEAEYAEEELIRNTESSNAFRLCGL